MKKSRALIFVAAALIMGLSSCGIFHKGCGCPHFGKIKSTNTQSADAPLPA